jgi:drug/metabolite transporter (DMT)-like permease
MANRDLPLLLLVAALMAGSFLFMKLAVAGFRAALLGDLRVLAAAGLLLVWQRARGARPRFVRGVRPYLLLGALNAAIPFSFTAWSELRLDASIAAVAMATIPLFTALFGAALGQERLGPRRWCGLAIGLAGVVVLSGAQWTTNDPLTLVALATLLVSAASYALGSLYARRVFAGVDGTSLTIGNFLGAGIVLAPFALVAAPSAVPSAGAIAALAGLVVLSTALSFRLYFHLIARSGATVATSIGFLIPLFGVLWGRLFLGEPLAWPMLLGGVLILAAVRLVVRPPTLEERFGGFAPRPTSARAAATG